ncbi:uncharacterized protein LOC144575443 [Carex rostrata]
MDDIDVPSIGIHRPQRIVVVINPDMQGIYPLEHSDPLEHSEICCPPEDNMRITCGMVGMVVVHKVIGLFRMPRMSPEKKVRMFSITMGILDLIAIVLGMLKLYLVVRKIDLGAMIKSITVLTLVLEGIRILCRSRGLELNHMHNLKQLPLSTRIISRLFYWLNLISVLTSGVLSTVRLASLDFGKTDAVLVFFCVVAILEALVFLAAMAIWIWKVTYCRLFEKVKDEYGLGMDSINRFYYDLHNKFVTGNILDALKMDLVTFSQELLVSTSSEEQFMGASILKALLTSQQLSDDALHKIGTSTAVINQLILMLNSEEPSDFQEEIRRLAAGIVSQLVDKGQNVILVTQIPGAMKSISSLLYPSITTQGHEYNLLGLMIVMKLAKEHDSCMKICNTHGLLDLIIDFTSIFQGIDPDAMMISLKIMNMLASTTGETGLVFRQKISEVAFTCRNIRNILCDGEPHFQRLALEVLTNLAMDEKAREKIGRTGGMVEELFKLFFKPGMTDEWNMLRKEAGKALAMLTLQNKDNCKKILKQERIVEGLTEALKDPVLFVSSSRILHRLCAFIEPEFSPLLGGIVDGFTLVFNAIMEDNQGVELLEASLGLAAQILKFMSEETLTEELHRACISDDDLINKLVAILPAYRNLSLKAPQIRRFAIELIVGMITTNKEKYVKLFKDAGIGRELNRILETTSEIECFNIFSGSVGLSKHQVSLDLLLDEAFKLLGTKF